MDRLAPEDRAFFQLQFDAIHQKMDLMIDPLKEDVTEMKVTVKDHDVRIGTLEQFKEGHQQRHKANDENSHQNIEKRRFYWEIIAGSGIFGAFGLITKWISGG